MRLTMLSNQTSQITVGKRMFFKMCALLFVLGFSVSAMAMGLEEAKAALNNAKAQGLVGETPAGYLAVVSSAGQAQQIVDAINQARREEYARIAQQHGIPVGKVELVAGQKAVDKTPAGQFVKMDGSWVKK